MSARSGAAGSGCTCCSGTDLRAHPDRARAYGSLKAALAERYASQRVTYTEAKGPFIDETLALAEVWAAATGWRL